jgi:acyl-CoA synthetase (AMP-forming)/AMP-acid ligase II
VTVDDTSLGILPFFHIYGMCPVMFGVLTDGGKLVTLPKFDPEQFLKALEAHKVPVKSIL